MYGAVTETYSFLQITFISADTCVLFETKD